MFLSQNWKFTAPVYIGDTITAEAEVISVHPSKPVTELRVQIRRDDGTTVLEGDGLVLHIPAGRSLRLNHEPAFVIGGT